MLDFLRLRQAEMLDPIGVVVNHTGRHAIARLPRGYTKPTSLERSETIRIGRSVVGHFGAQLLQCQRHDATAPRFRWIDTAEPADIELRRFEKQAA